MKKKGLREDFKIFFSCINYCLNKIEFIIFPIDLTDQCDIFFFYIYILAKACKC